MEQWSWPTEYDGSYQPAPDQPYWFPVRETMPAGERERLILARIREAMAYAHARAMWAMGIRPSDTVFIGSFFSLYMGSWGASIGAERLGASVFPFGAGTPGQTERAVAWMRQMRPTCFYGTPSYAIHLAEVACSAGVDPREFGLRILFFSGEPGASIPAIRSRIEEL